MTELLKELCSLFGPSGCEDEVREAIIRRISPHCEYSVDNSGNIIALKKGRLPSSRRVMLCAHMDEVGFMITWIDDKGLLKFSNLGGIDDRVLCGRRVLIGEKRVPGVIAAKPVHLLGEEEKKKATPADKMYIDIGCASKEEASALVSLGDFAVFDASFELFGEGMGYIKSKAIDDRAGCAVLCRLIEQGVEYDTYFAFTTCEEIGLRGAPAAAFGVSPDIALVVEGTTAADIPDNPPHKRVCSLGKGGVLSFMDRSTLYDRRLLDAALELARLERIPCQLKEYVAGGNDAGAIKKSGTGVRMMAASLPVRYLHTQNNVACVKDLESLYSLCSSLIPLLHTAE